MTDGFVVKIVKCMRRFLTIIERIRLSLFSFLSSLSIFSFCAVVLLPRQLRIRWNLACSSRGHRNPMRPFHTLHLQYPVHLASPPHSHVPGESYSWPRHFAPVTDHRSPSIVHPSPAPTSSCPCGNCEPFNTSGNPGTCVINELGMPGLMTIGRVTVDP